MKKWISIFLALQPCLLFAGGVTIGNGGDTSNSKPITITEVESIIKSSSNVLKNIFYALDLKTNDFNSNNPLYFNRLFSNKSKLISVLATAAIDIKAIDNCYDNDQAPKDGSVDLESSRICISSKRIQDKVNDHDAYVKITGLVAHELSHLAGTNEEEADDFQTRIEAILKNTTFEQWNNFNNITRDRIDFINFLYFSLNQEIQEKNWKTACKTASSIEENLQELLPKLSNISFYHTGNYSDATANVIKNKLAQIYICEKASIEIDELELASVELLFDGNDEVMLNEVTAEQIVLFGIIYDVPRTAIRIFRIHNDNVLWPPIH